MVTPMANQGALVDIGKILQEMEVKRQEDREQQERTLQVYKKKMQQQIQQIQQQLQHQRKAKKREHSMRQPTQKKETQKIPKFYGGCDPKIYLDWEAQVEQMFNENHVKDQTQVDLVVLDFLSMPKLGGIKFVKIMTKGHPRLLGWTLKLLCALDLFLPPIGRNFF